MLVLARRSGHSLCSICTVVRRRTSLCSIPSGLQAQSFTSLVCPASSFSSAYAVLPAIARGVVWVRVTNGLTLAASAQRSSRRFCCWGSALPLFGTSNNNRTISTSYDTLLPILGKNLRHSLESLICLVTRLLHT